MYYCEHFDQVKAVVDSFDSENAESIASAKQSFADTQITTDLAYLKTNFTSIIFAITKLETQGLCLTGSLRTMAAIRSSLESLSRQEFHVKMEAVLARNRGFKKIIEIGDVLERGAKPTDEYVTNLSPNELTLFKFCPVTSCDVERTFSRYGNIFTDNRHNFLFKNLKQHMIVHCNAQK